MVTEFRLHHQVAALSKIIRDEQVIKFSAMITKRDGDKTFYIDNIEVIDLEVLERLSK